RKLCQKITDGLKRCRSVCIPESHIVHVACESHIYAPSHRFALAHIPTTAHNNDLIGMCELDLLEDFNRFVRAAIVYEHELGGGRLNVLLESRHRQTTGFVVAWYYDCDTEIVVWHRSRWRESRDIFSCSYRWSFCIDLPQSMIRLSDPAGLTRSMEIVSKNVITS